MKVLFIGGTGIISTACTARAIESGIDLYLLNRGKSVASVSGAKSIVADMSDPASVKKAIAGHKWDAVVQWIAFHPSDVKRDMDLFRDCCDQYFFISSASAYEKTTYPFVTTEQTPLVNPYWDYSRNKIACEDILMQAHREDGFPVVIIRPSFTYGDTLIPFITNAWPESWTLIDRMKQGKPVIIPGNGYSIWTMTHNSDFAVGLVGLLGQKKAIGEAFHITSDESLTWNDYAFLIAEAAGIQDPTFTHVAADFIIECDPGEIGPLFGDKSVSRSFDNSKIKSFVPEFKPKVRFAEGIKQTLAWFEADPSRQIVDSRMNDKWDHILAAYQMGLDAIQNEFPK